MMKADLKINFDTLQTQIVTQFLFFRIVCFILLL